MNYLDALYGLVWLMSAIVAVVTFRARKGAKSTLAVILVVGCGAGACLSALLAKYGAEPANREVEDCVAAVCRADHKEGTPGYLYCVGPRQARTRAQCGGERLSVVEAPFFAMVFVLLFVCSYLIVVFVAHLFEVDS